MPIIHQAHGICRQSNCTTRPRRNPNHPSMFRFGGRSLVGTVNRLEKKAVRLSMISSMERELDIIAFPYIKKLHEYQIHLSQNKQNLTFELNIDNSNDHPPKLRAFDST